MGEWQVTLSERGGGKRRHGVVFHLCITSGNANSSVRAKILLEGVGRGGWWQKVGLPRGCGDLEVKDLCSLPGL